MPSTDEPYRLPSLPGASRNQPAPQAPNATKRGKFAPTERGYLPIDSSELRLESGKQHMFVVIDRVTKFTYVAFFDAATKRNGATFLRQAIEAFPYQIHTVLTDNGAAFTEQPRYRSGAINRFGGHIFDRVCYEHNIKHRLIKPTILGLTSKLNE